MIQVETRNLDQLLDSLHNVTDNLPKDVYASLNDALKKTQRQMAKEITSELNVAQKVIKKQMKVYKNRERLTVSVSLLKSLRLPLKDFGARQTRKGVTAKVRKGSARKLYSDAFIVSRYGGNVYARTEQGKGPRLPLVKLKTGSPWGALATRPNRLANVVAASTDAVKSALAKRIRYLELKRSGGLNWQQNTGDENELA